MAQKFISTSSNTTGLAGILGAVLAQAGNIQAADSAIDRKANNLMAAALVIVALLGTQLRNDDGGLQRLTALAMILVVIVVAMVLYATRNRTYRGTVVDLRTHEEYFAKDDELLLAQLIEDADAANNHNNRILENKRKLLRQSIFVFIVGFALSVSVLF